MFAVLRAGSQGTLLVFAVFVLAVLALAPAAHAEQVSICPHKIVLNAEGQSDDVQAIVSIVLPSANLESFDAVLILDGVEVAVAESAFYCAVDDNLIIGFDRTDLQNNPDVKALAGETVIAEVVGSVIVDDGGELVEISFSGSDRVQIVKPGNKK